MPRFDLDVLNTDLRTSLPGYRVPPDLEGRPTPPTGTAVNAPVTQHPATQPGTSPVTQPGGTPAAPPPGQDPGFDQDFEDFYGTLFGKQPAAKDRAAAEFADDYTMLESGESERQFYSANQMQAIGTFAQQLGNKLSALDPKFADMLQGFAGATGIRDLRGSQYQDWLDRRKYQSERTALGQQQNARELELGRQDVEDRITARKLWLEERGLKFDQDQKLRELNETKRQFNKRLGFDEKALSQAGKIAGVNAAIDIGRLRESERSHRAGEAQRAAEARLKKLQQQKTNILNNKKLSVSERNAAVAEQNAKIAQGHLDVARAKEKRQSQAPGKDSKAMREAKSDAIGTVQDYLAERLTIPGTGGAPLGRESIRRRGPAFGEQIFTSLYQSVAYDMKTAGWTDPQVRQFLWARITAASGGILRPPKPKRPITAGPSNRSPGDTRPG